MKMKSILMMKKKIELKKTMKLIDINQKYKN